MHKVDCRRHGPRPKPAPSPILGHTRNIDRASRERRAEEQIRRLAEEHEHHTSVAARFEKLANAKQQLVEEAAARAAEAAARAAEAQDEEERAVEAARQAELERLEQRQLAAAELNAAKLAKARARRLADTARSSRASSIAELRERSEIDTALQFHFMTAPRTRLEANLHQQTLLGGSRGASVAAAEHERNAAREYRRSRAAWARYAAAFGEDVPLPGPGRVMSQVRHESAANQWHDVELDEGIRFVRAVDERYRGYHQPSSYPPTAYDPAHEPQPWPQMLGETCASAATATTSANVTTSPYGCNAYWPDYPYEAAILNGVDSGNVYPPDHAPATSGGNVHASEGAALHRRADDEAPNWQDACGRTDPAWCSSDVPSADPAWEATPLWQELASAEQKVVRAMGELVEARSRAASTHSLF